MLRNDAVILLMRSIIFAATAACFLGGTIAFTSHLQPLRGPVYPSLRSLTSASSVSKKISTTAVTSSRTTMASPKPTYDVVVFGATSFAGSLVAEYYLTNYGASPPSFKWAVAGR